MKTNNISIILISELYQTKEHHSPSFNVSFFHNDKIKNLGNIEVNEDSNSFDISSNNTLDDINRNRIINIGHDIRMNLLDDQKRKSLKNINSHSLPLKDGKDEYNVYLMFLGIHGGTIFLPFKQLLSESYDNICRMFGGLIPGLINIHFLEDHIFNQGTFYEELMYSIQLLNQSNLEIERAKSEVIESIENIDDYDSDDLYDDLAKPVNSLMNKKFFVKNSSRYLV